MEHPDQTTHDEQETAQVIPLYINRPIYTEADLEHAAAQEQAA